ncbi:hypothetical protein HaLaN_22638 [Haematococcus lacustris]|uniref:Uncharacterized protein n=1 Tax=Haematococcus lacustris TaxID=44745 RepID=A0A699ZQ26_HAELA|nr:hypothetical protein HaLaN_22638 [Haematococcus lacustris]
MQILILYCAVFDSVCLIGTGELLRGYWQAALVCSGIRDGTALAIEPEAASEDHRWARNRATLLQTREMCVSL